MNKYHHHFFLTWKFIVKINFALKFLWHVPWYSKLIYFVIVISTHLLFIREQPVNITPFLPPLKMIFLVDP